MMYLINKLTNTMLVPVSSLSVPLGPGKNFY